MVSSRLASAASAPDSNASCTACSRPNSRNATMIDASVRSVRVFLRNSPAQSSGRYFTTPASRQERTVRRGQRALVEVELAARVLRGLGVVRDHHDRLAVLPVQHLQQQQDLGGGGAIEVAGG